jgi:hypothetical protein
VKLQRFEAAGDLGLYDKRTATKSFRVNPVPFMEEVVGIRDWY